MILKMKEIILLIEEMDNNLINNILVKIVMTNVMIA